GELPTPSSSHPLPRSPGPARGSRSCPTQYPSFHLPWSSPVKVTNRKPDNSLARTSPRLPCPVLCSPIFFRPVVDDSANRHVGRDLRITRRDTRRGNPDRHHEVTRLAADRVEGHGQIALIILDDAQRLGGQPEIPL